MTDPVQLTADLVRCPSVTPNEGGALVLMERVLSEAGFTCTRVDRGGISNLYARWGRKGANRTFGFNGHVDVVPMGDPGAWSQDPFGGVIEGDWLYGRGATDMKSGVAAFAAAAMDFVQATPPDGAVVLTLTGDEEANADHGTTAILDWMRDAGEMMSVCLVGEPTSVEEMGDMMKIGRRGSVTIGITAHGVQGHAAYPHRAKNPVTALARLIARLDATPLDQGTDHFDPSTLAVVTFDTGNPASNVIPAEARATVNIRFNDGWDGPRLVDHLTRAAAQVEGETGVAFTLTHKVNGDSFVTPPGDLTALVGGAVQAVTGREPSPSTSGGTSDARFVKDHCPVVEFGLVGHRMHGVDERVRVSDIVTLKTIYTRILTDYFA
ncbi:succinyl-diaminopimelate desuccinylase [Falsirhodobacter halotolerans]|uniref:succinyl-diaminopimelate desuccinylase n=1 Tax=Falsirhodobacter halotolerans TaxID=1146892 RepID=UPI001FD16848|nr:succinyl-diaminopimelate desuccinylase [Falsirhodobacter halotolerans]MCJ8140705.1 succinyl-diaminopimelate desuccinylase [Falsirhodobacter halotolerans]